MSHTDPRSQQYTQSGSALIYVLFIIAFVGIVLALVLTTVTQGQRNIVNYEQKQVSDYITEGAFEIIIGWMEQDAQTEDVYDYITANIGVVAGETRSYTPLGEQEILAQVISHDVDNEQIELHLYKAEEEGLTEKTLIRKIIASNTIDWNYPLPPPIPEEDEDTPEGEKTGAISYTEEGIQQNFTVDCLQSGTCLSDDGQSTGTLDVGDEYLYIPESVGTLDMETQVPVTYNADRGIIIGANIQTQAANADIKLTSCKGNIEIVGASFNTGTGQTYLEMNAGGSIIGGCTQIDGQTVCTSMSAGRDITLRAENSVLLPGSTVTAGSGAQNSIIIYYNIATGTFDQSGATLNKTPQLNNAIDVCP